MISPAIVPALLLQAAPTGGAGSLTPLLVQFTLIIAIIFFVLIRPQQKSRR